MAIPLPQPPVCWGYRSKLLRSSLNSPHSHLVVVFFFFPEPWILVQVGDPTHGRALEILSYLSLVALAPIVSHNSLTGARYPGFVVPSLRSGVRLWV